MPKHLFLYRPCFLPRERASRFPDLRASTKPVHCLRLRPPPRLNALDELLESPVDGRADVGDVLPEVNGGDGTLGDALGSELELLNSAARLVIQLQAQRTSSRLALYTSL